MSDSILHPGHTPPELFVGPIGKFIQIKPRVGHLLLSVFDVLRALLGRLESPRLFLREIEELINGFQIILRVAHDRDIAG